MQYPLELSSNTLGLDTTISDASGRVIFHSDGFAVFAGKQRTQPLHRVRMEGWMGLTPRFRLFDLDGNAVCTVRRNNIISLWKSWYEVLVDDTLVMRIREGKALGKTLGGLFEGTSLDEVSSRAWNPAFVVSRPDDTVTVVLERRRSFIQGRFTIKKQTELDESEERLALLSLFGLVFLEHMYG